MTRFQRPISASTKARQLYGSASGRSDPMPLPRRFLPTHAAMFGNRLQMPVTRSGHILCRLARHATRTQAATLAQGSIIFRPVRYPILLLRNVVTAIGIGLEWHGGYLRGLWMGVAPSIWD